MSNRATYSDYSIRFRGNLSDLSEFGLSSLKGALLLTSLLPNSLTTCVDELGVVSLTSTYTPALLALIKAYSSVFIVGLYQSLRTKLFTFQWRITITPLSKGIMNFFVRSIFKSSSPAPIMRMTFFGPTKPSSSACIPNWKYNAWVDVGMSINFSSQTTAGLNILRAIFHSAKGEHPLGRRCSPLAPSY